MYVQNKSFTFQGYVYAGRGAEHLPSPSVASNVRSKPGHAQNSSEHGILRGERERAKTEGVHSLQLETTHGGVQQHADTGTGDTYGDTCPPPPSCLTPVGSSS